MTGQTGRCETCKHWEQTSGGFDRCRVVERVFAAVNRCSVITMPPADFGCIYHEARPEPVMPTCECCNWWDCQEVGNYGHCRVLSDDNRHVLTRKIYTCKRWEARHG